MGTTQQQDSPLATESEVSKIAITLASNANMLHQLQVLVRADDGEVIAALEGFGHKFLAEAGFENFVAGPHIEVGAEFYEKCLESWGPTSRMGILRQARELCEEDGITLEEMASKSPFKHSGCETKKREFTAAMWQLRNHQRTAQEIKTDDGRIARIGRFLFRLTERGFATSEECENASAAAERMKELAAQQCAVRGGAVSS